MAIERRTGDGAPRRVLLVGWDAADWQMIQPLIERGLMPTTAKLMADGAWGNLATLRPILSPILWNSIATGKRAREHGVYGFTEPNPDGPGVRTSSSTSRKCKALWNELTQAGLRSNVVGWYASHPAEPINGVMVSNQFEVFQPANKERPLEGGITPPPPLSVHPAELADELAEYRVRPAEIDATAILPFVPDAESVAKRDPKRLAQLQQMLAQTATVHAVATHLMANTEWDLTAVYYEGIDRFGHEFMEFHPPKMDQVSQEDFDAYRGCMEGIYRFHDMMLAALLTLAGDETTVVLISDHGYYNNHLRPDPREGKAGPVDWHRPFGVLAAKGPGVKQGSRLYGASLLDVSPTVLHLLGLPAGRDMPGRVMAEILDLADEPTRIESWEEITDGDAGMHPPDLRLDPVDAQAALEQLVALGYIDAPSEDDEKTVRDTIAHNEFALAQSLIDGRDHQAALELLGNLDESLRKTSSVQVLVASCQIATNDRAGARKTLEAMIGGQQADDPLKPEYARRHMMLGMLEYSEGNLEASLGHFEAVAAADPRLPGLHTRLGGVYLALNRNQEAIDAYEKALDIDPESPPALEGIGRARLEQGDPDSALDKALMAAELVHHFPKAHLTIGRALLALGDHAGAVEALELCTRQAPRMVEAHRRLATAYRALGDPGKAMAADLRVKQMLAGPPV